MNSVLRTYQPAFDDTLVKATKERLAKTRFPNPETVDDWSQGIPLGYVQELVTWWRDEYDWSRVPDRLSRYDNLITEIEGIDIHLLHIRSPHSQAQPLIMTHGWPGSVLEFVDLIPALTDPTQHGGNPDDAFHVVVPSLPGFGFSGKPSAPGVGVEAIARMWDQLMQRLGYEHYLAHGGDWGSLVTHALLLLENTHCLAGHINLPLVMPDEQAMTSDDPVEQSALQAAMYYQEWDSGYSKQQSTRPQTLAYALADSPAGQLAWVVEKYAQWTDCVENGIRHPENALSRETIIDIVTHYWMTNSAGSSAKLYWESFNHPDSRPIEAPIAISQFPQEIFRVSERLARTRYQDLLLFSASHERGGHFASMENPEALLRDLRAWLKIFKDRSPR